jgi:septal ring factor EnvC (AmiA/AmiB activator)
MTDTSPEDVARMRERFDSVRLNYGSGFVSVHGAGVLSDAADMLEALAARLAADAKAHEKEIAVWSENYAAMERKLAEVEAEIATKFWAGLDDRKEVTARLAEVEADLAEAEEDLTIALAKLAIAEAENVKLRDACNQARLAFAGYVSVQSALNKLDALQVKP